VKPLITDTFGFSESIEAFEHAARRTPESVKTQIRIGE
jgi:threonine dehydrogenase-like Zn-dependent dehydrogenase